jgi:BlaI family penicillinase repressor
MKRIPRISESEWEVLSVLWDHPALTANEVFEKLCGREWKLSTVRTFLARLEKKGAVRARDNPAAKTYSAILGREECVKQASQSFLDRVFDGATASLLVHFAKSRRLSARELDELDAILKQKRKGE